MFMRLLKSSIFYGLLTLAFVFTGFDHGFAQSKFINRFRPLVDSPEMEYEIPAPVMLGISIIESSSGTSINCKLLNNYFGIVGKNKLSKTTKKKSRYKQYADATASFVDFCRVISRKKFY